jgi:hypothetical protein
MYRSTSDYVRQLTGARQPLRSAARQLRGRAWLTNALQISGLSKVEFGQQFVYRGRTRSNVVDRWLQGDAIPKRHSALAVEKLLPGTLAVYDYPLFAWLEDRPMSRREASKLLSPYRQPEHSLIVWKLPNDEELRARRHWVPTLCIQDTHSLFCRGDFWGFQIIVGLVRLAEAEGSAESHWMGCEDMYRALPAALKEPWLRPHADLLCACIEQIRSRSGITRMLFDVDMETIKRQALDPEHETIREYRPRDPETFRFVDLEDPILEAHVIPGRIWRDSVENTKEKN